MNRPTVVLALCNHKGGTGKTTTALNLGAAIGMLNIKTLLIDLDPQGFLTRMVDVPEPHPAKSALSLYNPRLKKGELEPIEVSTFDLIPASRHMTKWMKRFTKPTDHLWIRESLRHYDGYDLIILDTAAAVTVYCMGALVATTHVVIPVTPEIQPVYGASSAFNSVAIVRKTLNPGLKSPFFLITQADGRKTEHRSYAKYLRDKYGAQVLKNVIRTNSALAKSYKGGRSVFHDDPRARGARDYANAAHEILGILGLSPADP